MGTRLQSAGYYNPHSPLPSPWVGPPYSPLSQGGSAPRLTGSSSPPGHSRPVGPKLERDKLIKRRLPPPLARRAYKTQ
jgi:hypothetical protein